MKKFLLLACLALLPLELSAQFLNQVTNCATSNDGSVVGTPNPLTTTTASTAAGTLPAGTYYIKYTFYAAVGETLPSPEQAIQLTVDGGITIAAPTAGIPTGALGMNIYIGAGSGSETLQGSTTGNASYVQSIPLVLVSVVPPTTNSTVCQIVANDAVWPTGTGYDVTLADSAGNTYPGFPMQWQLMGPGSTINLTNGLPYYHGVVMYPTPILASPLNHQTQSILGGLNLGGYSFQAGNAQFNNVTILGNCTGAGCGAGGGNVSTHTWNTYDAGTKQIFTSSAATAGMRFATNASTDPNTLQSGDTWYSATQSGRIGYSPDGAAKQYLAYLSDITVGGGNVSTHSSNTYDFGTRQTFSANGTTAGFNLRTSSPADPSGLIQGDVFLNNRTIGGKGVGFFDGVLTQKLAFLTDFASPPPIGNVLPNYGVFTDIDPPSGVAQLTFANTPGAGTGGSAFCTGGPSPNCPVTILPGNPQAITVIDLGGVGGHSDVWNFCGAGDTCGYAWAANNGLEDFFRIEGTTGILRLDSFSETSNPLLRFIPSGSTQISADTSAGAVQLNYSNAGTGVQFMDGAGASVASVDKTGKASALAYRTNSHCDSNAAPAVCGSAAAGAVVVAAAATTVVVNTTAVTANSQIFVQQDTTVGGPLSTTCNTAFLGAPPQISSRSAGTSFTISISVAPVANAMCFNYWIVN